MFDHLHRVHDQRVSNEDTKGSSGVDLLILVIDVNAGRALLHLVISSKSSSKLAWPPSGASSMVSSTTLSLSLISLFCRSLCVFDSAAAFRAVTTSKIPCPAHQYHLCSIRNRPVNKRRTWPQQPRLQGWEERTTNKVRSLNSRSLRTNEIATRGSCCRALGLPREPQWIRRCVKRTAFSSMRECMIAGKQRLAGRHLPPWLVLSIGYFGA